MPTLVQDALANAAAPDKKQTDGIKQEEADKLQALSRQTGLSIETLRLIKKVEDKVTERKQETTMLID